MASDLKRTRKALENWINRSSRPTNPLSEPHAIRRRLGAEALERLQADYEAGATTRQLAARYGIGKTSVQYYLHQAGVPLRRQALTPKQIDQAIELYAAGFSFDSIGATLDVVGSTVYRAFELAGLSIRRKGGR